MPDSSVPDFPVPDAMAPASIKLSSSKPSSSTPEGPDSCRQLAARERVARSLPGHGSNDVPMARAQSLSQSQARRIALAAQGLAQPLANPTAPAGLRQLTAMSHRLAVIQIDSINVLARAHLMPLFSRLGHYKTADFERMYNQAPRRLVETWAHEASLIEPATWPLLAWRRRDYQQHSWSIIGQAIDQLPDIANTVLDIITDRGPLTSAQMHDALLELGMAQARSKGGWWNWNQAKRVLEAYFFTGEIASAGRTAQFERRYDLASRVIPASVLAQPTPDDATAVRQLLAIAAKAQGVGTQRDLVDYFRLGRGTSKQHIEPALADLVDAGLLSQVTLDLPDAPSTQALIHSEAVVPRAARRTALLSPFDPLVFYRPRLRSLFDVDYRIEVYTPAHKRVHGYYCLLFLDGEHITARVDLKADRKAPPVAGPHTAVVGPGTGVLRVQAAHHEPHVDEETRTHTPHRLAQELRHLAKWLGLAAVTAMPAGELSAGLQQALRSLDTDAH